MRTPAGRAEISVSMRPDPRNSGVHAWRWVPFVAGAVALVTVFPIGRNSDRIRILSPTHATVLERNVVRLDGAVDTKKIANQVRLLRNADESLIQTAGHHFSVQVNDLEPGVNFLQVISPRGNMAMVAVVAPRVAFHFDDDEMGWQVERRQQSRRGLARSATSHSGMVPLNHDARGGFVSTRIAGPVTSQLDLIFVVDTTVSMGRGLELVKSMAKETIAQLRSLYQSRTNSRIRVGVVSFRDVDVPPEPWPPVIGVKSQSAPTIAMTRLTLPIVDWELNADRNDIGVIDQLPRDREAPRASGNDDWRDNSGGQLPEDQYIGIARALEMCRRQQAAAKTAIIAISDALPKANDKQGNSLESITTAAQREGIPVYPVVVQPQWIDLENVARTAIKDVEQASLQEQQEINKSQFENAHELSKLIAAKTMGASFVLDRGVKSDTEENHWKQTAGEIARAIENQSEPRVQTTWSWRFPATALPLLGPAEGEYVHVALNNLSTPTLVLEGNDKRVSIPLRSVKTTGPGQFSFYRCRLTVDSADTRMSVPAFREFLGQLTELSIEGTKTYRSETLGLDRVIITSAK